jgi:hypothetical protein
MKWLVDAPVRNLEPKRTNQSAPNLRRCGMMKSRYKIATMAGAGQTLGSVL